jgi:NAD(P)-dependent dehydrogenase (short-subunit alcohol dehydrogenase family)
VPSEVALVTGGGRGIGANIARELAASGRRVAVSARTGAQVDEVAREIGGLAIECDVTRPDQVEAMAARVESELGPVDLLVNNAGIAGSFDVLPDPQEWWRVFETNVLGAYLCTYCVTPGMRERGSGRIVNLGSGAAYLPGSSAGTAYGASKAALGRFSEVLANRLREDGVFVFLISPGLVRTELTDFFPDDAPWTPPELAPRLVRAIADGRLDRLAGRYLHAEHDQDLDALLERADSILADDLNAIRLRR